MTPGLSCFQVEESGEHVILGTGSFTPQPCTI